MTDDHTSLISRSCELLGIDVEHLGIDEGLHLKGHGHDQLHCFFLFEGAYRERCHHGIHDAVAGEVRVSPAGDEHEVVFAADSRALLVTIHGALAGVRPCAQHRRRYQFGGWCDRLQSLLGRWESVDHHTAFEVELLLLEMLASAHRTTDTGAVPTWLNQIRDRIAERPERPPTADELASLSGYHPVHVARLFRKFFGLGLGEFARARRAWRALDLISEGSSPLAQVALHAGYSDQSHLCRSMRRLFGITPSALRRNVASVQSSAEVLGDHPESV